MARKRHPRCMSCTRQRQVGYPDRVGAELSQVFARFGARVTVVEALTRLLPTAEPEAGDLLANVFAREEIEVRTGTPATRVGYGRPPVHGPGRPRRPRNCTRWRQQAPPPMAARSRHRAGMRCRSTQGRTPHRTAGFAPQADPLSAPCSCSRWSGVFVDNQMVRRLAVSGLGLNAIDEMPFVPARPLWSLTIIASTPSRRGTTHLGWRHGDVRRHRGHHRRGKYSAQPASDVVMNLVVGRRRTLRGIERDLADSDPRLARLLADFTRLTRDEDMPAAEKLKLGPISMLRSAASPNRPPEYWRSLFWTLVLFAILAVLHYALMIGGTGHCVSQACTPAVHGTASGSRNPGNAANPGISPNSSEHAPLRCELHDPHRHLGLNEPVQQCR